MRRSFLRSQLNWKVFWDGGLFSNAIGHVKNHQYPLPLLPTTPLKTKILYKFFKNLTQSLSFIGAEMSHKIFTFTKNLESQY